jgi:hypothetical protein
LSKKNMSLLNTAAGVGENKATTEAENMQTANAILNKPKKVSSRPVEPVPFNAEQAQKQVDFARSNTATGSVSDNSLVRNQLNNVLATDGPLLKRARSDGFASAAERGLNNSSMGVQAGEEAVIRQALQIATPDAQTYGEMDRANLSSAAGMAQTGVQQAFADYNNDKNYKFTAGENKLSREHQTVLQDKNNAFVGGQNDLDRTQKQSLFTEGNVFAAGENKLGRDQQTDLQKNDQLFTSGENALSREQQVALQRGDQSFQAGQQDKQNQFSANEAVAERSWKSSEQQGQNIFASAQQDKQNSFSSSEQDRQNSFASKQQGAAHDYQLKEIKANADEQIRVASSQIDDKFKAQYLDSASSLQRGYLDQQTAILTNSSGRTSEQVANALAVANKNFEASVGWMQGVYAQGGPGVNAASFPVHIGPIQTPVGQSQPAAPIKLNRYEQLGFYSQEDYDKYNDWNNRS